MGDKLMPWEEEFLGLFLHLNNHGGEGIAYSAILSREKALSQTALSQLDLIIGGLLEKKLIKVNKMNLFVLTPKGGDYLFGQFDMREGAVQVMKILNYFEIEEGSAISLQNIQVVQNEFLTVPQQGKIREILTWLIHNNYLKQANVEWYLLTQAGARFLDEVISPKL